jgi:hypothetical protein
MFIFLGGPPGPSNTRDDKKGRAVARRRRSLKGRAVVKGEDCCQGERAVVEGKGVPAAPTTAYPLRTVLSLQQPSPICHPERSRGICSFSFPSHP